MPELSTTERTEITENFTEDYMSNKYYNFFEKMALLEIVTLRDNPDSRNVCDKYVTGVYLQTAFADKLQSTQKFDEVDWNTEPFSKFEILKKKPPGKFYVKEHGSLGFDEEAISVSDWKTFIDSFRQLRNNLFHGAKLFKSGYLKLNDRDNELIEAGLEFINYLEKEQLVTELY